MYVEETLNTYTMRWPPPPRPAASTSQHCRGASDSWYIQYNWHGGIGQPKGVLLKANCRECHIWLWSQRRVQAKYHIFMMEPRKGMRCVRCPSTHKWGTFLCRSFFFPPVARVHQSSSTTLTKMYQSIVFHYVYVMTERIKPIYGSK